MCLRSPEEFAAKGCVEENKNAKPRIQSSTSRRSRQFNVQDEESVADKESVNIEININENNQILQQDEPELDDLDNSEEENDDDYG